jgi:hypothetical protein
VTDDRQPWALDQIFYLTGVAIGTVILGKVIWRRR